MSAREKDSLKYQVYSAFISNIIRLLKNIM